MADSTGVSDPQNGNEQLLALINNMSDGFLAIDNSGVITLSNSVALGIIDHNVLKGKQLAESLDVIDKNGSLVDLQKTILTSEAGFTNSEWSLRYKDGSTIGLQISVSPVRSGFGQSSQKGFVLLLRDISQEKSVEAERDEFISVASHELRTPVAVAEGSLSNALLLADRAEGTSESIKHSLKAAHDQVIFLSHLINDLAMLSRADRGKAAQTIETFSVSELIETLIHDHQPEAAKKRLTLEPQVQDDAGLITNSRLYVREILQNFISNALKYTEEGGVVIAAAVKKEGVEFKIIDTGIGIAQNEKTKLFSKFFRSEDWRVRQNSGTGLGLYVTSKLAKLIDAVIEVDSELNRGSTFTLFVPNLEKPAAV